MTRGHSMQPGSMRLLATAMFLCWTTVASAQSVDIKGYGMVGGMNFSASESFDAVFDSSSGVIRSAWCRRISSRRVMWFSSRQETSFRPTAKSWRA